MLLSSTEEEDERRRFTSAKPLVDSNNRRRPRRPPNEAAAEKDILIRLILYLINALSKQKVTFPPQTEKLRQKNGVRETNPWCIGRQR